MDDPIFDAVFALCFAAEQAGYESVATALELVLDVYLLERRQLEEQTLVFVSRRSDRARQVAMFEEALSEDQPRASPVSVGWSMRDFPMMEVS